MRRTRHLEPYITPWAQFHAYVLGSVIGIRWGKITPSSGMGNDALGKIVREYLVYAAGDNEWNKRCILDAMRDRSGATIKDDARYVFPSLFPRNKRARPLGVPEELKDEKVFFDPARIEKWSKKVKAIKKEIAMNENVTSPEATEVEVTTPTTGSQTSGTSRVKVNFVIPTGVDPSTITLENYREVTGTRFRMTKDQKDVRGLSRSEAFAEAKALAVSQLGD